MDLSNVPEHAKAGLQKMNADAALAEYDTRELTKTVLDLYQQGYRVEDIATHYNVTAAAIYKHLIRHAESEWKEYQAARALAEHDTAEKDLQTATDGVQVSRARELARMQQWKLERVLRRIYGDAPSVQVNINIGDVATRIAQLEQELGIKDITPPIDGQTGG